MTMAEVRTVAKGRSKWGPGVTEETDGDRWGSLHQDNAKILFFSFFFFFTKELKKG